MVSTTNVSKETRKMKHARFWKNVILWAISRREISPLVIEMARYQLLLLKLYIQFATTGGCSERCRNHNPIDRQKVYSTKSSFVYVRGIWTKTNWTTSILWGRLKRSGLLVSDCHFLIQRSYSISRGCGLERSDIHILETSALSTFVFALNGA